MSDAMKPNQATLVTSLETTDYLLATDSSGKLKRITRSNAVNQDTHQETIFPVTELNWIRIATIPSSVCGAGIICISNGYWGGSPNGYVILVTTRYNGGFLFPEIKVLSGNGALSCRAVKDAGSVFHIEIKGYQRRVMTSLSGVNITLLTPYVSDSLPADAEIHTYTAEELSGGGVKHYLTAICNLLQKGGHHDRSYRPFQRHAERGHDRCVGLQRNRAGYRCLPSSWHLSGSSRRFQKHTFGSLPLWSIESDENSIFHHTGVLSTFKFRRLLQNLCKNMDRGLVPHLAIGCVCTLTRKEVVAA